MMVAVDDAAIAQFRARGFALLRGAVDGPRLRAEVEQTLAESEARPHATELTTFAFAPMMSARTPCSLALVDALEPLAARLLDADVVPIRAKGVRYSGSTRWHPDSTRRSPSVGFIAYLDPLTATTGALRVLPASHRPESRADVEACVAAAGKTPGASLDAELALETRPGDLIVMDERLFHASAGGVARLQWRVDYVRAPTSPEEVEEARALLASIFTPDWDGGYDPDVAPTYDEAWLASSRPSVARLEALGVHAMARAQEAAMRARRARGE